MAMKRPNGTGNIVKLSGKRRRPYAVRVFDGVELKPDGNAKQKYKYVGYFEKHGDAMAFLEKYNATPVTLAKPKQVNNKHKFSEIFDLYISELEKRPKKLSNQSYQSRTAAYNNLKSLHNMVFEHITLEDLEKAASVNSNKSQSSIANIKMILKGMYKTAMRHKYVSEDLSALMIVDHLDKAKRPHNPFTEEEIDLLWKHKDEFYPGLFLILIYTGMRITELLEIKSENVYLDKKYMVGGKKTAAGRDRIIPLSDKIIPLLDTSEEYLISVERNRLSYHIATSEAHKKLATLGLSHTFHDTRHTCATLLEQANIPILHRKLILGHSSRDITDRYTHVSTKQLIEDINLI